MNLQSIEEFFLIKGVKNWYLRFERPISSLSLVGGFIFDIFALDRVDEPLENFWVGMHLLAAALGILFINMLEQRKAEAKVGEKTYSVLHFWLIVIVQFGFGGLLSVFLVFYFRSSTLAASWPFLVLLAAAFVANERLKRHYTRLVFQLSLLFLCIYSFSIYMMPVLLHRVGDGVFLLSGAASIVIIFVFLFLLRFLTRERFRRSRLLLGLSIGGIIAAVNILYFTNLIPPIPLSLKDGGIYHSLTREASGAYRVEGEPRSWLDFFKTYDDFHAVPGEPVYAWTAVFSPTDLDTTIIHEWQYYNEAQKQWVTASRVTLPIVGGRGGGFRTYSMKSSLFPGHWRVNVENVSGQIIGRLSFNVVTTMVSPPLETEVK